MQDATKRTSKKTIKIKQGKMKQKTHIGNLENYSFQRAEFLKYLGSVPAGSKVTWRYLAIKFQLKNKHGVMPSNAGQVFLAFAKANGINTDKFNTCRRVSGRNFVQRIRRSKQKINRKVSVPTPRSAMKMRREIQGKLGRKELSIGERIAPKTITTNKIDSSGDLISKDITVYGRMIPLTTIIKEMKEAHKDLQREVSTEGTQVRYIKLWHDHSDILNHSYQSIMASTLYDSECFLKNAEYREKFPERPNVDVQALVEKPFLFPIHTGSVLV